MKSYSFGTTPRRVLMKRLPEAYPMELSSKDAELVTRLVNQGIDSHLEAVILAKPAELVRNLVCSKLKVVVTKKGMLCLLRRLYEDGSEEAWSLRSSIVNTLGIEEI